MFKPMRNLPTRVKSWIPRPKPLSDDVFYAVLFFGYGLFYGVLIGIAVAP